MKSLFSQIVSAIAGLWLASLVVSGVAVRTYPDSSFFGLNLTERWQVFLILGTILGLLNFFVRPVLNAITLPLRVITLGLFSIVTSMAMIWILDMMFAEISMPWLFPLLWTTVIIWAINSILSVFFNKNEE